MALTKFNKNVNNNQSQPDQPTLTAEQMKKLLDQAGIDIKEYLNEVLTEEIDILLNGKAPNNHASSGTTYGVGTENNYGHNKVINNLTKSEFVNGESLSAYQGKVLKGLVDEKANSSHTHTKSEITDFPASLKNPNALTLKLNGTINKTYDGSSAQTFNVTPSGIGASPTNHANSATTYGVGTTSNYGHNKVINNLTADSYTNGESLSAYQGKVLNDKITNLTVTVSDNYSNLNGKINNTNNIVASNYVNLNDKFSNYLPLAGGTLTGQVNSRTMIPSSNNTYNLGSTSKRYDHVYARYLNATGSSEIGGALTIGGNTYINDGAIQSNKTYSSDLVDGEPNLYITTGGWIRRTTNTSSRRYKEDIKELENEELNPKRLYDLKIKQFKYKDKYQPTGESYRKNKDLIGFIAEEVAEVYPIAVDYNDNGDIENWNTRYIIPAMLKLIQDQKKEIEELKKEIHK